MKKKQLTREKILDIVFMLVYINGYNGTSISMILKECGIPKGSLYHYFKSKKAIVLAVLKERIKPKMDEFYKLDKIDGANGIDIIIDAILKVAQKEQLVLNGCPLNRLNQEMSPVDKEFEKEITLQYNNIKEKIKTLLDDSKLKDNVNTKSLAEHVIQSLWGALSLNPSQSSVSSYLDSVSHIINYLQSLKK